MDGSASGLDPAASPGAMKRLGGLPRLGIILTLLWCLAVGFYLWAEYEKGPFSPRLLTDTVVTKTGEPLSVLKDNPFVDLVPVHQVLNMPRLSVALSGPIISMWRPPAARRGAH